jgi:hypothetical protein
VDLAAWLAGRWTVRRDINAGAGAFVGIAAFEVEAGQIVWREDGCLRLPDFEGPAYRTLRLIADGDPGAVWQVSFEDGRPFHQLDLRAGRCEAVHYCGEDTYRGLFVVETEDHLDVTWRVTGPRKDDTIASVYERTS